MTKRSTVRIRSVHDGTMYHLVFDGNLSKLSVATLKRHLEPITTCPVSHQELTLNGRTLRDVQTGADVGIHDGIVLDLRTLRHANSGTTSSSGSPSASDLRRQGGPSSTLRHYPTTASDESSSSGGGGGSSSVRPHHRGSSATARSIRSQMRRRSSAEEEDVECLFIEDDGVDSDGDSVTPSVRFSTRRHHTATQALPAHSHISGTMQSRSMELKDDLNWVVENKRFETERLLKEWKLRRHEVLLAQQSAMLEKEFEEIQRVLMYETLRGDIIQRDVRKSRELEALRRPRWGIR